MKEIWDIKLDNTLGSFRFIAIPKDPEFIDEMNRRVKILCEQLHNKEDLVVLDHMPFNQLLMLKDSTQKAIDKRTKETEVLRNE